MVRMDVVHKDIYVYVVEGWAIHHLSSDATLE